METPEIRSIAAFRREGWTPRQIDAALAEGTLERVRRGRYAVAAERTTAEDHLLRSVAVWQSRSPDHVVSHTSAAVLHGLPVRAAGLTEVHLTRWGATHGKVTAGVRLHRRRLPDEQVEVLHGVRVTSLERTVADVGRLEPFEWGVVAADAALQRGADPLLLAELIEQGRRTRTTDGSARCSRSPTDGPSPRASR